MTTLHRKSTGSVLRGLNLRLRLVLRSLTRSDLRNSELALIGLAAAVGLFVGVGVVALRDLLDLIHHWTFLIPAERHLSEAVGLDPWRVMLVPCLGGLVVGLVSITIRKLRPREIVDAIEANALFGGRMSLIDSLNLAFLTLLSGGFGASVGLEAAYTQLGSGLASKAGRLLKLRRNDLRMLVGCGAAAAIAAAFNAPLAGAFYAFELIVGSYTLDVLAPITLAALTGTVAARLSFGAEPVFVVDQPIQLADRDYVLFAVLGVACGGLGILTMKGVTRVELWLRTSRTPAWLRPALGGFAVGLIAFAYPQVLGSGHGAIEYNLATGFALPVVVGLVIAKIIASAISIGSGFRGGLFSSALFLGTLFGSAFAKAGGLLVPSLAADQLAFSLVGMGAVGAAIVGAPITMILLVLEGTGNFPVTIAVMIGVLAASITVRNWFGYSFATWRFHVRGLRIRSPQDIGWIQDLTVARVMRRDPTTVTRELPLGALRERFPLGGAKRAFVVGENGEYLGLIDLVEAHAPDLDAKVEQLMAGDLAHQQSEFLLPQDNIKLALTRFMTAEAETLAVLDNADARQVIGFVTEGYLLRRYNQELEKRGGGMLPGELDPER
ncbi:MAG: chloride channel protein [Pseudomonadota bacterium]